MVDAPWLRVAWHAITLGIGLYLIPLAFMANPALIALESAPLLALLAGAKIGLGIWLVSRALILPAPLARRALHLAGGLAVIFVGGF